MTTTLSEGVKVPDVGSVNWAGDLEVNWNLLNGALANLSGNVKLDRDNTWTGEQSFTLPIIGSITGTAAKAIADEDGTSIKTGYVNVAGNQTVSGDKSFTGSNTFNSILPNATNTYSLGTSTNQWKSVYSQTYYYNGTAWGLDKSNVWTGTNTYASLRIANSLIERGVTPSANRSSYLYFIDKNNVELGRMLYRATPSGERRLWLGVNDSYLNGALDPTGTSIWNSLNLYLRADGKAETTFSADLLPETNNSYNLGTSTNKWKTLNGVNPGALSLPDKDNSVDITSEFTDLTGGDIFYIPLADGWITITADNEIFCAVVSSTHRTTFWCQSASATSISNACVTIPVKYTQHFRARIKSTNAITVTFYPCLGNV